MTKVYTEEEKTLRFGQTHVVCEDRLRELVVGEKEEVKVTIWN